MSWLELLRQVCGEPERRAYRLGIGRDVVQFVTDHGETRVADVMKEFDRGRNASIQLLCLAVQRGELVRTSRGMYAAKPAENRV